MGQGSTVAMWLAVAACGGRPVDSSPGTLPTEVSVPSPTSPLEILSVTVRAPDSSAVYLVQQLDVTASEPVTLTATLTGPDVARVITWAGSASSFGVPLIGLRAFESYTVTVEVEAADGRRAAAAPVAFTNSGPPPSSPQLSVLVDDAARREPGWTLLSPWSDAGPVLLLLDPDGVITWAYVPTDEWRALSATGTGTLIALDVSNQIREIDWLGRDVRQFAPDATALQIPLAVDRLHHDVIPVADGSLYVLTSEGVGVDRYPIDYERTGFAPAELTDTVLAYVGADGASLESWSMAALLDTARIGWGSLQEEQYGQFDWCHGNGVAIVGSDDSLIVSIRHQDAVVKIDRATGAVRWIFGHHDGWTDAHIPLLLAPVGPPFQWPGHQHAPFWTPDGKLLLFDNGNDGRTNPYSDANGGEKFSRVAQFTIDEVAMTASLDWAWSDTSTGLLFSSAVGNADLLSQTGNVLATFSYLTEEGGVRNADAGRGTHSTRLIEFQPTTGLTVSDLSLWSDAATVPSGWLVDRATHIDNPYGSAAVITLPCASCE